MRIVAGEAKGRKLKSPRDGLTRPFTGKAKEAVFSMLGLRVVAARVLDLYAGSGSLGLEALSRGASTATFVDSSREALVALRVNVSNVGLGGDVVSETVERYLGYASSEYDLIFVDPPYSLKNGELLLVLGAAERVLAIGGVMLVRRRRGALLEPVGATMLSIGAKRRYGDTEVWWLDKEER